ncbi:hypothetical protein P296_00535 [Salmonella enterica subsp. arizonae serovar 18:z4,z23:- str. CVM N26624]|uniref:Uncharacterized protein n=1 Tax=Salmonella enterica subsp. arizonae serovar 18:z4,z23:- str. CVM N26626 TaxID=1395119 RepID=A0A3S5YHI5_SALER|nr:hypothetical protein N898_05875 [Salmonella enterica subsp. arizonae serovar 62:z36:- str. RKS2983]OLV94229.1 hypothetical protein P297_05700 [Salmonella enterica subsp. arizonae serovar 18:z4,z23:- str. CVM N26625]OLV96467.1 hypothetical protein P298_19060 [Salmonella enterica subsp. arizonae serovar 18:z4,z23:- str. CVM N26626]OLW04420.1 hypothetical protein P296_00535 [Salmonella enterica subsp. arizonae serovar 18:z4,z23:- str. CVM N26624]OLW06979.1 hypothetical protein P295_03395 [Salmo
MGVGIDNDQGGQGCKWQANLLYTPFGGGFYLYIFLILLIKNKFTHCMNVKISASGY